MVNWCENKIITNNIILNILDIQNEANRIKLLDTQYTAFADYMIQLAETFEDEQIIHFIQPYINN